MYPAERAIRYIGEPAFLPLIDEFLRTAPVAKEYLDKQRAKPAGPGPFPLPRDNDTEEERAAELLGRISGVLSDCKLTAKALDEAKRRLFAHPDDKKTVRGCKELIRCLMANDYNREIHEFTTKFPPPWWNTFEE